MKALVLKDYKKFRYEEAPMPEVKSDGADGFDRLYRKEPGLLKMILTP
jgi:hypothetical protein